MDIPKARIGVYKRNGYTDAQRQGIANWSKSMVITGKSKKKPYISLDDHEFRKFRRKVENLMDEEQLIDETKEVWE